MASERRELHPTGYLKVRGTSPVGCRRIRAGTSAPLLELLGYSLEKHLARLHPKRLALRERQHSDVSRNALRSLRCLKIALRGATQRIAHHFVVRSHVGCGAGEQQSEQCCRTAERDAAEVTGTGIRCCFHASRRCLLAGA